MARRHAADPPERPVTRPGLGRVPAAVLVAATLALHLPGLDGPFRDGQAGNCGAMFAIMARNAEVLGIGTTLGIPVLNPVPPGPGERQDRYTHHPPGLPWAVQLASRLPLPVETASRLVALAATLATLLLVADLAARLLGRHAAWAAGLLVLSLPAARYHGLLVNYETVALPAMLALTRTLVLGRGGPATTAALAGLMDWIALAPLVVARSVGRRARLRAAVAAAVVVAGAFLHAQLGSEAATADTIGQAWGATFLAPGFSAGAWGVALADHLGTLYGWSLIPALLGLAWLPRRDPLVRRVVGTTVAVGVLNVVVFARHATGHEHYALLLLPGVVLATASLLFPRDVAARPPPWMGATVVLLLVLLSSRQVRAERPVRSSTRQADLAAAFAAVTDRDVVHLRTEGASLVFLHRAARHVWPYPVHDLEGAREAHAAYRRRFGVAAPAEVVLPADAALPPWLAARGPGSVRGPFRFVPLTDG